MNDFKNRSDTVVNCLPESDFKSTVSKLFDEMLDEQRHLQMLAAGIWRDKYMREVEGLNNEGDPIGGDPPSGLRHEVERLRARVSELESQVANQPKSGR